MNFRETGDYGMPREKEWKGLETVRRMGHHEQWGLNVVSPYNQKYTQQLVDGIPPEERKIKSRMPFEEQDRLYEEFKKAEKVTKELIETGTVILLDDNQHYYCPNERDKPEMLYKDWLKDNPPPPITPG